jgi:hypothetical protein
MKTTTKVFAGLATGGMILGGVMVPAAGVVPAATAAAPAGATAVACNAGTRALLTLSRDDGHIEAEIELHARRAGQRWRVRFFSDGIAVTTVNRKATASEGGGTLSVSRLLDDHAGPDVIKVVVKNRVTKERCVVKGIMP